MKIGIATLLLFLCVASCSQSQGPTGTLQGHVTIGPLVPVVREGEDQPTPLPEVYTARQIVIFSSDMRKEIIRATIDAQGNYRCTLPEGEYIIDINHLGIDHAAGFPRTITIKAGEVLNIEVDIDTGIR